MDRFYKDLASPFPSLTYQISLPSCNTGKLCFVSKEEYKIPSCRTECFLVERTKDLEWESFGFFPVSTPDQMWKLEKITLPRNTVSYLVVIKEMIK